jgi:cytochrome c oxidase cbb3-type subunit 3
MLTWRAVKETTLALALALALAAGVAACDQAPSADGLPEWKPSDHHSVDDNAGGGASGQQAPAGGSNAAGNDTAQTAQLVEMAWRQQCTLCHGAMGRGDGPNGPLFHPRDLSDPQWQATVSDADLASSIKNGKNRMPKFDLPDPVLQGIVARIRMLKAGKSGG